MASESSVEILNARIAHLEDNRRYIQNALEMVLSLEDFYTEIGGDSYNLDRLLPEAKRRIDAIFPFEVLAFYMVDETDLSFTPAYHYPDHLADVIQEEVDYMIDGGYFAWAIRERRGVVLSSSDHSRQYLLHVIANHNQVKGMFGGLLPAGQTALPDTAMTLLSIILLHVANASESMAYTNLLKNQSRILEQQVAERTRALTQSQQELQAAMEKSQAMADAAQAASRAKGDFLAKMSHELRTPLNGIIGMTEVALSSALDDKQRRIIEIIGRESYSLLRQINDVLDFSKIESGKLELERIEFDLRTLMDEVGENFAFQTCEKGLELNVYIDPMVPARIEGDPVRLRQILLNLAGNAVKFTHEGEILIEARLQEDSERQVRIRFSITDTGIGIEAKQMTRVFSSFTQADNSTTRQYGGTGLGTTISKQLVELMGGRIGVDSRPGKGSTFWFTADFTLPDQEQPMAVEGVVGKSDMKILVVDHSSTTCRVISDYLKQLELSALTATSGDEALALLAERANQGSRVDVIITADWLSAMDSLAFKDHVRQMPAYVSTPVILATSLKEMVAAKDDVSLGFDAAIAKPVKIAELKAALGRVVNSAPAEPVRQAVSEPDDQPSLSRCGHILVADDYQTNQQVVFMHLTAVGFSVDLAEDGQQAVDAFECNRYDLILMDIQMPVLNGFDATCKIREIEASLDRKQRTPIIALTANAMQGDEKQCLDAGMDGYLTKPVHRHQLIKAMDHWIGFKGRPQHTPSLTDQEKTPGVPATGDAAVMDTATAVEEFGDADTVKVVARQLIENVDGQLRLIRESIANEDRERIRREAHAIKGGAATMEAIALSRAADHLEKLSPDGPLAELGAGFGDLEDQFNRFREFVSQWKGN